MSSIEAICDKPSPRTKLSLGFPPLQSHEQHTKTRICDWQITEYKQLANIEALCKQKMDSFI